MRTGDEPFATLRFSVISLRRIQQIIGDPVSEEIAIRELEEIVSSVSNRYLHTHSSCSLCLQVSEEGFKRSSVVFVDCAFVSRYAAYSPSLIPLLYMLVIVSMPSDDQLTLTTSGYVWSATSLWGPLEEIDWLWPWRLGPPSHHTSLE